MTKQMQSSNGHQPHHFRARWRESFRSYAHKISIAVGSPWAFAIAAGLIILWAISGRLFHYSDTWQLVINTATTIITFLMVFIIQNTQNRDTRAIQLKLDELLRGVQGARNRLVALETLTDEELDDLEKEFEKVRKRAAERKLH
jgi:low affinity Fe/Cu permease